MTLRVAVNFKELQRFISNFYSPFLFSEVILFQTFLNLATNFENLCRDLNLLEILFCKSHPYLYIIFTYWTTVHVIHDLNDDKFQL